MNRTWSSHTSHLATGLDSAKLRTKRTQALGDRALPDLMAAANAADHEKEQAQASDMRRL